MSLINAKVIENTLYLYPEGRIDSNNAPLIEEEALGYVDSMPHTSLVIDADKLEYISSAGLRVILKLKKRDDALSIINVCGDVYDVFEMTGFSEMIHIEKAYRRLSIEGCEMIGRGANGEVYRLDDETIIKVYLNPDALGDIKRERELARKAFVLGIPTAIPYDVVRVNNTYGSVFELLKAASFSKLLAEDPSKLDEVATQCSDLLKKIHSTTVQPDDMPNMKDVAVGWVKYLEKYLPADKYSKLLSLVESVPVRYTMMHGDFHTKNVMMQNGEILLIDMDTLCYGDPIFEFGSIYNAFIGFNILEQDDKPFLGIDHPTAEKLYRRICELYFDCDSKTLEENHRKAMLIGTVRILRRTIKRVGFEDPFGAKVIAELTEKVIKLIDEVDSLTLGGLK